MKIHISILLFFFVLVNNAQKNSITLPKSNEAIKVKSFTPILSIYVDKNYDVYLEDKKVSLDNLLSLVLKERNRLPLENRLRLKTFIYVDKNVNYDFIDEIKTQLASVNFINLVYKTNTIEEKDLLKGVFWRNHKYYRPYKEIKPLFTENVPLKKSSLTSVPVLPLMHWSEIIQTKIYSDNKEEIKKGLNERQTVYIKLVNDGLLFSGKKYRFEELKELFIKNDIILVSFDDSLKYDRYIHFIVSYKKYLKTKQQTSPLLIELSRDIIRKHKKNNINIIKLLNKVD